MNKVSGLRKILAILLVILLVVVILSLIPFKVKNVNAFGCEIKSYDAVFYTVVQIDAKSFSTTKVYPFPSNIEVRGRLKAFSDLMDNVRDNPEDFTQ